MQRRFGTVPDWASQKIAKADLSDLEEWSLRIFDAQSLDEVFSDKVSCDQGNFRRILSVSDQYPKRTFPSRV
ncbi:MAG: hypothetical protein HQL84_18380 [Magnetococcales bacterium]|nr:hypothetical protein [Magnetococcales bacterium]MBF0151987.1 hypothetical protein [Magnetococcales bacterium]MBF0172265.1 hypothetical protein [Magnetococcales bacterium]